MSFGENKLPEAGDAQLITLTVMQDADFGLLAEEFAGGVTCCAGAWRWFVRCSAIAAGANLPSLASFLKGLGYRTICIHPYPASFYQRDRVSPRLGFGEFLDIREFDRNHCSGPYISDSAVADKIAEIVRDAADPVFIFAITMENHGPLHLEQVAPSDIAELYSVPPPAGCDDLPASSP